MLTEIDRFTSSRHRAEPRLRTVSVWIGELPDEQALTAYLSPDDPAAGGFARDLGEDWYDADALEASHHGDPQPVAALISRVTESLGLPTTAAARLLETAASHGTTVANAVVLLHWHTFDPVDQERPRLSFAGTVEYLDGAQEEDVEAAVEQALARPELVMTSWQLFTGVTSATSTAELEEYARGGGFVTDMGGDEGLDVDSFDPVAGMVVFSHGLKGGEPPLNPEDFFDLPDLTALVAFDPERRSPAALAARREVSEVNAMIAFATGPMRRAPGRHLFCGLRHIGVLPMARLDR